MNNSNSNVITRAFKALNDALTGYLARKVNDREVACDLAQDVWLAVAQMDKHLNQETMQQLVFSIAYRTASQWLRGEYARMAAFQEMPDPDMFALSPQDYLEAWELARLELQEVEKLPMQRRNIYIMSRYDEKSVADIASTLDLSERTVENHLRLGRRDIRSALLAV